MWKAVHALIGAEVARKYRENPLVVNAIASHHNEVAQESIYAVITQVADAISASRPGARRENYAAYIKRVQQLEEIAKVLTVLNQHLPYRLVGRSES